MAFVAITGGRINWIFDAFHAEIYIFFYFSKLNSNRNEGKKLIACALVSTRRNGSHTKLIKVHVEVVNTKKIK